MQYYVFQYLILPYLRLSYFCYIIVLKVVSIPKYKLYIIEYFNVPDLILRITGVSNSRFLPYITGEVSYKYKENNNIP